MKLAHLLLVLAACGGAPKHEPAPPAPAPAPEAPMPTQPAAPPAPLTQSAQPQALAFPDEAFRATQPGPEPERPFHFPPVHTFTLKNGLKVFLVEQHTLPIVSMDLNFDGGGLADPKGKDGMAGVCASLLTEGTEKLDKLQYAGALADIASNINAYATDDAHGVTLSTLTKHLDATFALFADTLRTPGLRPSDFDRLVKRRIEGVKQAKGNPAAVSSRITGAVLYGLDHPFGAIVNEKSLGSVTLDDCKKFAHDWFQPKGARLFVVGDLTEAQVRGLFEASGSGTGALASWKGTMPHAPALPAPHTMKGRIFFVNIPGAAQSSISYLQFGPKRSAAEYFQNAMMGAVFGGGFASRINMNLREDKGYSYGARGSFTYTRSYGTFSAGAPVRADASYQTLLEIDREIKDISGGKKPIIADELEREKRGAVLGLPARFSTGQSALGQYRSLVYFGLPLDYYASFVANVNKVTLAQAAASAAHQLKPGNAVYVVVGDADAKMIVHEKQGDKWADVPYTKDGQQLTLRQALDDLAKRGDVGKGGLVELDVEGHPVAAPTK
ncbi:MAG TPA: pitrilysin family protein [Kofleriaceae bacterium]|jgi:predicted Zn-dependent peptidase